MRRRRPRGEIHSVEEAIRFVEDVDSVDSVAAVASLKALLAALKAIPVDDCWDEILPGETECPLCSPPPGTDDAADYARDLLGER